MAEKVRIDPEGQKRLPACCCCRRHGRMEGHAGQAGDLREKKVKPDRLFGREMTEEGSRSTSSILHLPLVVSSSDSLRTLKSVLPWHMESNLISAMNLIVCLWGRPSSSLTTSSSSSRRGSLDSFSQKSMPGRKTNQPNLRSRPSASTKLCLSFWLLQEYVVHEAIAAFHPPASSYDIIASH